MFCNMLDWINRRILVVHDYEPYQVAVFLCAVWLVVALALQLPILIRTSRPSLLAALLHPAESADWQVVMFRASLLGLATAVVVRYFFNLNPWIIVFGWLTLDVAATLNTIYIRHRARAAFAKENIERD